MKKDWKMRLGLLLLGERVQVRKWNASTAAKIAKIDAGTLGRIESGANYEVAKLDKYAKALGRPTESWLREALAIPEDLVKLVTDWSAQQSSTGKPSEERTSAQVGGLNDEDVQIAPAAPVVKGGRRGLT